MIASTLDVRWDVILSLQSILRTASPGTYRFDVADLAIGFTLNPRRTVLHAAFLRRNVLRDGSRDRQRRHREIPFSCLRTAFSGEFASCDDAAPPLGVEASLPSSLEPAPDHRMVAGELEDQIRCAAAKLDNGHDVLDGMLAGESPNEMASRLDLATHRIYRLRSQIRELTLLLLERERTR